MFHPFCDLFSGHRIDTEASSLKKKLDGMSLSGKPSSEGHLETSEETTVATIEVSLVILMILVSNITGFRSFCDYLDVMDISVTKDRKFMLCMC